jgi:glycosyltransferase involved in cell wall biosynthesis
MRIGVAHPGTQHSWQTAFAFQEGGDLSWYATSYYYKTEAWPDRLASALPGKLRTSVEKELRRRRFDPLDDQLVRRAWETEFIERPIGRHLSRELMLHLQEGRHRRFPHRLLRVFAGEPVDLVWGPFDCLEAFDELRRRGVTCVLDQPIGHFAELDAVMAAEYEIHPEFFLDASPVSSPALLDRQRRAAEVADAIVVGSDFARQTMLDQGSDPAKVHVVPYGYDELRFPIAMPSRPPLKGRPVEFLFVGTLEPRKGAAYLLKAFKKIDPRKARLTIVGPMAIPRDVFAEYQDNVTFVGQVTRGEIATHMSAADCFVFPSLFEGGGIVLYEAAACGLGLIQTKRCGDGVRNDANGVILDTISVDSVIDAVERACDQQILEAWRASSWDNRLDRQWSEYRKSVRRIAHGFDSEHPS